MKLNRLHLDTLSAILREGSFEKAAELLHITPSAVSQRVRALEERVGAVLIVRDTPCRATSEGQKLHLHTLQTELLEFDLVKELGRKRTSCGHARPVSVNADSLAVWFVKAIDLFSKETGQCIELFLDDENHTMQWLKEGRVLGAVTTEPKPIQGCRAEALGALKYAPLASPDFAARHFPDGLDAQSLSEAPMILFNRKDDLPWRFLRSLKIRGDIDPPCHWIPSSHMFQECARMGLGWILTPEQLAVDDLKKKTLVNITPGQSISVPLYWHAWRLNSDTLKALTKAVKTAARSALNK